MFSTQQKHNPQRNFPRLKQVNDDTILFVHIRNMIKFHALNWDVIGWLK